MHRRADDWGQDEYEPPEGEDAFANAVTSAAVEPVADTATGTFTLAYLEQDVDYIIVIVVYTDLGDINEIPIVLEGDNAVTLDQNTVNLGTLNTDDYTDTMIIPGYEPPAE